MTAKFQKEGVVFAVPSLNHTVCLEFLRSWTGTQWLLFKHGIESAIITAAGDQFVAKARNHLVTKFLNEFPGVENFFFLDDDIGWTPRKAVEFLLRPQDIVCGVYPKKCDNPEWPVTLEMTKDTHQMIGDGDLFSATLVPTGFMRIKRRALELLVKDVPIYEEPDQDGVMGKRYNLFEAGFDYHPRQAIKLIEEGKTEEAIKLLRGEGSGFRGEDIDLVDKWRGMGFQVYVDPDIEFSHRGQKKWVGNFADTLKAWRTEFEKEQAA